MPLQLESVSSQQADITQRLRIVLCFVANIPFFEKGEREKLVGVITLRRILFLLGNDHYKYYSWLWRWTVAVLHISVCHGQELNNACIEADERELVI